MNKVDYDLSQNRHTLEGARTALLSLLGAARPRSLLDVGCGTGTWLRAALDLGIEDVVGIDGLSIPSEAMHVPRSRIRVLDLRGEWELGRRFDLVLCLEVAEHLPPEFASSLIERLTRHGDRIFFSAAIPWQGGQNHIHCQWPSYWQGLFNERGFVCRDTLRWRIWEDGRIEPWYRQNLFLAERNPVEAGSEPRIPGVIHPEEMLPSCRCWRQRNQSLLEGIARGIDRVARRILGMKGYE